MGSVGHVEERSEGRNATTGRMALNKPEEPRLEITKNPIMDDEGVKRYDKVFESLKFHCPRSGDVEEIFNIWTRPAKVSTLHSCPCVFPTVKGPVPGTRSSRHIIPFVSKLKAQAHIVKQDMSNRKTSLGWKSRQLAQKCARLSSRARVAISRKN